MNLFIKIFMFLIPISLIQSQDCKSKIIVETDIVPVNILINDSNKLSKRRNNLIAVIYALGPIQKNINLIIY